jgi:hypothetical protein
MRLHAAAGLGELGDASVVAPLEHLLERVRVEEKHLVLADTGPASGRKGALAHEIEESLKLLRKEA